MSSDESIGKGGSYLPRSFTNVRGLKRKADPTFVQHSSAMDVGYAEFDVELSANADHFHNEFPEELHEPLLHWLGYKTFPLRASLKGVYLLDEKQWARWSVASVGGGPGLYEYSWAHWISCPPSGGGSSDVSGASLNCDAWHSAGSGNPWYEVDSLSVEGSPHGISVTVTDRYARDLAPARDTIWVKVDKRLSNLDRFADAHERDHDSILEDNYPNPFNPSTMIRFSLPEPGRATLSVYDMSGRLVATLADRYFEAGTHNAAFDGSSLASGTYYYTIRTADRVETRLMLLLK